MDCLGFGGLGTGSMAWTPVSCGSTSYSQFGSRMQEEMDLCKWLRDGRLRFLSHCYKKSCLRRLFLGQACYNNQPPSQTYFIENYKKSIFIGQIEKPLVKVQLCMMMKLMTIVNRTVMLSACTLGQVAGLEQEALPAFPDVCQIGKDCI